MQVKTTMMEMFFVTDKQGEVMAGPFFFAPEAEEWIRENGGNDDHEVQ